MARIPISHGPSKEWTPQGKRLRKMRELARLTIHDVADEVGYSYVLLSMAENGRRSLSSEVMHQVEDAIVKLFEEQLDEAGERLLEAKELVEAVS